MTALNILLLKLTGLFIGKFSAGSVDSERTINSLFCKTNIFLTAFLCLISAIFFFRTLWVTVEAVTFLSLDRLSISGFMLFGFALQQFLSVVYLISWQLNNSIHKLNEMFLRESSKKPNPKPYLLAIYSVGTCFAANFTSISIQAFVNKNKNFILLDFAGYFPSVLAFMYGEFAKATCLAIFVTEIQQLSHEFNTFNKDLQYSVIKAALTNKTVGNELGKHLQAEFLRHNQLTNKIVCVDRIFRIYTFTSLCCVLPTGIMATILMLRRSTVLGVYYSTIEVLVCVIHLCGITLVPAATKAQFLAAKEILHQNPNIWQKFVENITHSQIGISYGGLVLIDKHMIFNCVSFVVPYAVLCVQANMGSQVNITLNF